MPKNPPNLNIHILCLTQQTQNVYICFIENTQGNYKMNQTITLNELTGVTTSLATFRNNIDELQATMGAFPTSDPIHADFSKFTQLMKKLDDNLEVQIEPELLNLVREANNTWQQIGPRLTDH